MLLHTKIVPHSFSSCTMGRFVDVPHYDLSVLKHRVEKIPISNPKTRKSRSRSPRGMTVVCFRCGVAWESAHLTRNVLRFVPILARWIFILDVIRPLEA